MRKQPIGVVTVVTLDTTSCKIDGYVVTIPLPGVVTGSSPVGTEVVTKQNGRVKGGCS
jgi:hypothetical protein